MYLDDVIVFGRSFEETMQNLSLVFDRFKSANLKLKPKKCHLFMEEVTYLGYVVSESGVKCDPCKLDAIKNWPIPSGVADVRSFLGLASYYRQFIENFSTIAYPLTRLTQKDVKFKWTDDCSTALEQLKHALMNAPVLAYPTLNDRFILDTDASAFGIGAVLSQLQNGVEKVIAYSSKTLSKSQRRYCTTYRELLAVVSFVKQFKHYLYGRPFLLRTDHSSLTWLKNFKEPEGMIARWLTHLDTFDFEIQHRRGILHGNADALSRAPVSQRRCKRIDCPQCTSSTSEGNVSVIKNGNQPAMEHQTCNTATKTSTVTETNSLNNGTLHSNWTEQWSIAELERLQAEDEAIRFIADRKKIQAEKPDIKDQNQVTKLLLQQWDRLELKDGLLYRIWRDEDKCIDQRQIVTPKPIRSEIMQLLHGSRTSGHLGREKTLKKIQSRFYWPGMTSDIARWCEMCTLCSQRRDGPGKAPMQHKTVYGPMECIALDVIGPLPETDNGNQYILVIGDYFSKWMEGYAVPNHTAQTVADVLVTQFICRFGTPTRIHTDQGPEFESRLFAYICSLLGIAKTRTTPYRPQSDGLVERFNRTLQQMLSLFVNENRTDWDDHLPFLMMAYRSCIQESTKCTPNLLMLGREISLPIDVLAGRVIASESTHECPIHYVEWIRDALGRAYQYAFDNLELSVQKQKKHHDEKLKVRSFNVGDFVWRWSLPKSKQKLCLGWNGPYKIVRKLSDVTYEIGSIESESFKKKIVHVDHLKKYPSDTRSDERECASDLYPSSPLNEHFHYNTKSGREVKKPDRYGLWDA